MRYPRTEILLGALILAGCGTNHQTVATVDSSAGSTGEIGDAHAGAVAQSTLRNRGGATATTLAQGGTALNAGGGMTNTISSAFAATGGTAVSSVATSLASGGTSATISSLGVGGMISTSNTQSTPAATGGGMGATASNTGGRTGIGGTATTTGGVLVGTGGTNLTGGTAGGTKQAGGSAGSSSSAGSAGSAGSPGSCGSSFIACGCGCCGAGPSAGAYQCYYPEVGDSLAGIIAADDAARSATNCEMVGCSIGIGHVCCTSLPAGALDDSTYSASRYIGGYDRINITKTMPNGMCATITLVSPSKIGSSKYQLNLPTNWAVESAGLNDCTATATNNGIGGIGDITLDAPIPCKVSIHGTLFTISSSGTVTSVRMDADALAQTGC